MFFKIFLIAFLSTNFSAGAFADLKPSPVRTSDEERKADSKERLAAAHKAIEYFSKNPKDLKKHADKKIMRAFIQATKKKKLDNYLAGVKTPNSKKETFMLHHPALSLLEIGYSMLEENNRENVFQSYKTLYNSIPPKYARRLTSPKSLLRAKLSRLQKEIAILDDFLAKYIDVILEVTSIPPEPEPGHDPMRASLTSETGHRNSDGVTVGDQARQCSPRRYHSDGIINQTKLAQNQKLTSIKNQRSRGTCTSFAIAAVAESEKIRNGYSASNFSEQSVYAWTKYTASNNSGADGINTLKGIKELKKDKFKFGYETIWPYNQSHEREDFNGTTYPFSCTDYLTGRHCSGRSSQLRNVGGTWYGHFASSGAYINSYSSLKSFWKNKTMNRLKALTRPAIISMTVDRIFANSANESDGYLRINRDHGDFDKGGHAMMYVGYILNQNLPDGAPDANGGGYVVVKNSWGLNRHDCGFYYLDHDYVKERITGLVTIDI
jgi:hypothetical protein